MNAWFEFKQFAVEQQRAAMKVGTDGVLLGAWARVTPASQILDVGTGTGLVALMAAQRNATAKITAVEIDPEAALQAEENFRCSPWAARLQVVAGNFCMFAQRNNSAAAGYDCILSNPPYFEHALASPTAARQVARHTQALTHAELLQGVLQLLQPQGRFAVILPCEAGEALVECAAAQALFCVRKTHVANKQGSPAKRLLLEFSFSRAPLQEEWLYIRSPAGNDFSAAYRALTCDFYLKF